MFLSITLPRSKPSAGRVVLLAAALLAGLQLLWIGTEAGAETTDYSNDFTGAHEVTLGTPVTDGELTAGDVDVFTFTVDTGETKDVWIYTSGETDTLGRLFDDSSTAIATATPVAENNDSVVAGTANFLIAASLGAGTYFIGVSGAEDTTEGMYSLHSMDLSTATDLILGTAPSNTSISADGEIDVFEFTTAADP